MNMNVNMIGDGCWGASRVRMGVLGLGILEGKGKMYATAACGEDQCR